MEERPLNIILLGKTGQGKSSTGNFIVGKKVFKSKGGSKSITKEITLAGTFQDGRTIKVVDTPGLFDTDQNLFDTALTIQTSLKEVLPGPHAFLIVLHGNRRYTEEENKTQLIIQLTFGAKIFKHALIILTHEDEFDSSEDLLMEAKSVKEQQAVIELCGGRCITLSNLNTDKNYRTEKLKNIIKEVDAISKNGKVCYTEDLTAYTQALKEQAKKKTSNEDLTVGLLAKYLEEADAEAKRRVKAAYEEGKESGEASGISTGLAIGAVAGAGLVGLGIIGLGGMIISRNPKPLVNAVKLGVMIGATILEEKRKRDDKDMRWEPPNFREAERLFSQQSQEKFFSLNGK